jgi:DNA-binding NarL/FixJ family response regulator
LKEINPEVRTLLSTGCDMDGHTQALLDEGMCGIVQKPYQVHEFASAVADALKR